MRPPQSAGADRSGFSLVEAIVAVALFALLLSLTIPALSALSSTRLTASGRELADFLHHCRSRAIAKRTVIRVGFVVSSPEEAESLRRYAAWEWDKTTRAFVPFTSWHSLATEVKLTDSLPLQAAQTDYARNEPSAVAGDSLVSPQAERFQEPHPRGGGEMDVCYFDFLPSGRARCDWGEKRNLLLCLVPSEEGPPAEANNWVHFSIDTLTGRVRVYRP